MTTAPALETPKPKYAIGDTVWVATVERSVDKLPCPDCLGSKKWMVRSPAGGEYTTDCPRCQRTYSIRDKLPALNVETWVGKAAPRLITGMDINAGRPVEYRARFGDHSYWTVTEDKSWLTEAEAKVVADAEAASKNVEAAAKPEVLTSRHFASLTLDEGRWDQFKNGIWNSQYHAGCLIERVREALEGEDGNEERSVAEVVESLRDAVRWDFKYHVDNLPLTPLVIAALASSDAEVRSAAEALPETMRKLLSGAYTQEGF